MSKYDTPSSEQEILPNRLGLTEASDIEAAETLGFLFAQEVLLRELIPATRFDLAYLYRLHRLALGHLYDFAGELRRVNVSKGGFLFPTALLLEGIMLDFERHFLNQWVQVAGNDEEMLRLTGMIHAELLFIHPFREGNGRAARLLADLMIRQSGSRGLDFGVLSPDRYQAYIVAVQSAAAQNYQPMISLLRECLVTL